MVKNPLGASVPQDTLRIKDVTRIELIRVIGLVSELKVQGAVSQSRKRWLLSWRPNKKRFPVPSSPLPLHG